MTSVKRNVTILKIIQPNHFLVKVIPDEFGGSSAQLFVELETQYLNNYDQIDVIPTALSLPMKGSYVLVKPEDDNNWYRGRVEAILETVKGARVSTYLLDYGRLTMARKEWIREMPSDLMKVPFQALDLILPKLRPCSMQYDSQLLLSRQPSEKWDTAAIEDIRTIVKIHKTANIYIDYYEPEGAYYGQLVVLYETDYCNINKFLIENNYACGDLLESDTGKVMEVTDNGLWIWLGGSEENTGTHVGDVYIRPSTSLSDRLSRNGRSSRLSLDRPLGRHHQRGRARRTETPDSMISESLDLSFSGQEEEHSNYSNVSQSQRSSVLHGPASQTRPSGVGRGQALLNLSTELRLSRNSVLENVQEDGDPRALNSSFGSSTPVGQNSPVKPCAGRGQALLNLATELRTSQNNLIVTNRSGSSLSVNEGRYCSLSETSSSTLSKHSDSADSDKIYKLLNSRCTKLREMKPTTSRDTNLRLRNVGSSSHSTTSVNKTCQRSAQSSYSDFQAMVKKCQSSSESENTIKNCDLKIGTAGDKPVLRNGNAKNSSVKNSDGPTLSRNGFVNRLGQHQIDASFKVNHVSKTVHDSEASKKLKHIHKNSFREILPGKYVSTILRFGSLIPKPVRTLATSPLTDILIQRMECLGFTDPSKIQSSAWPAILRGRSVALIAPRHSGKTLACLLPLLSFILQPEDYQALDKYSGSLAVVLCANWEACHEIHMQCMMLLPEAYHNKVACIFGSSSVKKEELSLIGGCDLLITTPTRYLQIQKVVQMERCCHIMLDEADLLTECYTDQIREIMVAFVNQYKSQPLKSSLPNQILLCSSLYTSGINSFIQHLMLDPIIFISSYLEAAVYAKVPVYTKVTSRSNLSVTLTEMIRSGNRLKTVVCTTCAAVALEVSSFLTCQAIYALVAHEQMEHFHLNSVKSEWEDSSSSAVLVISDHVLPEMDITCAEWLIHFDLPSSSRLEFGYRFVCLAQNIQMKGNCKPGSEVGDSLCHILVTPECEGESLGLIRFLKRIATNVPKELLELGMKKQLKSLLCPKIQAFGVCKFKNWCSFRHVLKNTLDQPASNLPHWGEVKVFITHVVDASQFYGRLIEYRDPTTGASRSNRSIYLQLQVELTMYFGKNKNVFTTPAVGDICAIYKPGDAFHRVKILGIRNVPTKKASVFLLDEGGIVEVVFNQLYELPEELKQITPLATHIFVCGVEPVDGHQQWLADASIHIHKNIYGKEVLGKVALCLKDTLFLEPLIIRSQILKSTNMITFNHNRELIKQEYAVSNPEHVSTLRKLCEGEVIWKKTVNNPPNSPPSKCENSSTGLTASTSTTNVKQNSALNQDLLPTPQRACNSRSTNCLVTKYETLSAMNIHEVYVSIVESPGWFYVQPTRSYDDLSELNKRINNLISTGNLKKAENLESGSICLSPLGNESDHWFRAVVVCEKSADVFELFFVDFGDSADVHGSNIFEITSDLLELPFQAIECSLANVGPVDDSWTREVSDEFISLTRDEDNIFQEMKLKVLDSTPSRVIRSQRCYRVKIYDQDSNSVGSLLIDKALAVKCSNSPPPPLVCASDIEADGESSVVSMSPEPEEEEKRFRSALIHQVLGENTRHIVETSDDDDESIQMKRRKTKRPAVNGLQSDVACSSKSASSVRPDCSDMPILEVVPNATPSILPRVQWFQTEMEVILNVEVHSYQEYELYCTSSAVILNILRGDQFFSLKESLFDDVVPTECQAFPLGRYIKIKLHKFHKRRWPRLLQQTEKVPHVTCHHDHIATSSCDETASTKSFRSERRGKGAENKVKMTTLHYDPRNMDDCDQDTGTDSDWSKEDAYNMFS